MADAIPSKNEVLGMLPDGDVTIFRSIHGAPLHPTVKSRQWCVNAITHKGTVIVGVSDQTIGRCLEVKDSGGSIFIKVKE